MIEINDLTNPESIFQDLTEQEVKSIIGGATSNPLTNISNLIATKSPSQQGDPTAESLAQTAQKISLTLKAISEALQKNVAISK
jgi:hypothetical protein